jgi:hypothetical protein
MDQQDFPHGYEEEDHFDEDTPEREGLDEERDSAPLPPAGTPAPRAGSHGSDLLPFILPPEGPPPSADSSFVKRSDGSGPATIPSFIRPPDDSVSGSSIPPFIIPPAPPAPGGDDLSSMPSGPDRVIGKEWGGASVSPDPQAWEHPATPVSPAAQASAPAALVPRTMTAQPPEAEPPSADAPPPTESGALPPLPPVPPSGLLSDWAFGRPSGGRAPRGRGPRKVRRTGRAPDPVAASARGRGKVKRIVALGVVVALTSGMLGYHFLVSKAPSDTALALSFQPGQTYRYHVHTFFDGKVHTPGTAVPERQSSTEDVSWRVLSVTGGIAKVSVDVTHRVAQSDGWPLKPSAPIHLVIRVAPDGRIITGGGVTIASGPGTFPFPGSDQVAPLLPQDAVSPGDNWSKDFDQQMPFGLGKINYSTENRFVRFDSLDGVRAAVIDTTATISFDVHIDFLKLARQAGRPAILKEIPQGSHPVFSYSGTAQMHQTAWLDPARGELLKSVGGGQVGMVMHLKDYTRSNLPRDGMIRFTGKVGLSVVRMSSPTPASPAAPATQPATGSAGGAPAATPATGPAAQAQDDSAQSDLRNALIAARMYFVDGSTYVGFSPQEAAGVEPGLRWSTSATAMQGQVSIREATATSILLVTRSASGRIFCMGEVVGSATAYGKTDARSVSDCRGGW